MKINAHALTKQHGPRDGMGENLLWLFTVQYIHSGSSNWLFLM